MRQPLVTVIIPSFNHRQYIESSINSVLQQTYPAIELIVIDDGSTDGSPEVIEALSQRHGFAFYQHANRGVCATLNRALEFARGEFIVNFGSDDIMLPDRIERQTAYMLEQPQVGCIGARTHLIDSAGKTIKMARPRSKVKHYQFDELLRKADAVGTPTAMYRHAAIVQAGGFDTRISLEDFQISLNIAAAGYRVDILPFAVTCYRLHGNNYSNSYRRHFRNDLLLLRKFKQHPAYLPGRTEVFNRYLIAGITKDLPFAARLFARLPLNHWNRSTWKRYRDYCYARMRRWLASNIPLAKKQCLAKTELGVD